MPAQITLVELVELAAVVADQAPVIIRSERPLASDALTQYWSAAKCRQERWSRSLKLPHYPAATGGPVPGGKVSIRPVLEEILATEVLTRLFTAILASHDRRRHVSDAEPIGRSVLAGHLEARHRGLSLLVYGPCITSHDAIEVNRLRRQAERWSDLLIGKLLLVDDLAEFAIDADVAQEFAADFRGNPAWQSGGTAWSIAALSLGAQFRSSLGRCHAGDDNERIAAAILGCLGADHFDSLGLPRSLWSTRLLLAADSAQGMLDELFAAEGTNIAVGTPRCRNMLPGGR